MPIRPASRTLYPPNWSDLSRRVRFERGGGCCQGCGRPHLAEVRCLPDGRWFDIMTATWRDRRGRPARWPDLIDILQARLTRVVLAAAHLDNNPANNRLRNLRGFCQRCHLLHDRPFHLAQRWLTYRNRLAIGDLFFGRYGTRAPAPVLFAAAARSRHKMPLSNDNARPVGRHNHRRPGEDLFAVPSGLPAGELVKR